MCPRDIHVLDAVSTPHEFYLVCDACQLIFKISDVDQTYVERGQAMNTLHITYTYNKLLTNVYTYNRNFPDSLTLNMRMKTFFSHEGLAHILNTHLGNNVPEWLISMILTTGESLENEKDVTVIFTVE